MSTKDLFDTACRLASWNRGIKHGFDYKGKTYKNYICKEKFEELWDKSEPITKEFINTLTTRTWLRNDITPYELYLKFIYEFYVAAYLFRQPYCSNGSHLVVQQC